VVIISHHPRLEIATGASTVTILTTRLGLTRASSAVGVLFSGYNQDQPATKIRRKLLAIYFWKTGMKRRQAKFALSAKKTREFSPCLVLINNLS